MDIVPYCPFVLASSLCLLLHRVCACITLYSVVKIHEALKSVLHYTQNNSHFFNLFFQYSEKIFEKNPERFHNLLCLNERFVNRCF